VLTQNVLILGGSGQDGAFLAERYIQTGLKVFSVSRNESTRLNNLGVKFE
jgi:GDP-D-mannose dehydratase